MVVSWDGRMEEAMPDRLDELKGRVKETAGKLTDDERLEAEGKSQAEGARAKRKAKGGAKQVGGAVKEGIGKLTRDEATEAEGKAERVRGRAERTG